MSENKTSNGGNYDYHQYVQEQYDFVIGIKKELENVKSTISLCLKMYLDGGFKTGGVAFRQPEFEADIKIIDEDLEMLDKAIAVMKKALEGSRLSGVYGANLSWEDANVIKKAE